MVRHDGLASAVAWAHPKQESLLATAGGQDAKIKVWRELPGGKWEVAYQDEADFPVNCISWAPWEYGLILAAGTADGRVYIYERVENGEGQTWKKRIEQATSKPDRPSVGTGIKALAWSPAGIFHDKDDRMMLENPKQELPALRFVALS
jgi:protein transport protein SEC13